MSRRSFHPLLGLSHADVTLLTPERAWNREDLSQESARVAQAVRRHGVKKGDRVLWVVRSSGRAVVTLLGCLRAGAVVVPVNSGYQQAEFSHVLTDAGARLCIFDDDDHALATCAGDVPVTTSAALCGGDLDAARVDDLDDLDDLDDIDDDDLALLIYTSGTTGRSKGCAHTWGGLLHGVRALMTHWAIGPADVVVHALPLFHVHGLCVALLGALSSGATTRLLPRFTPVDVVAAAREGGTVFMGVPTMIHRLLEHLDAHPDDGHALGALRLVTCGSAALSAEQLIAFRARTGLTILERYGMSETLITLSNPLHGERRAGAVGWPVPGVETRIVDDELHVRAPFVMRGYWNRADADREVFVDADDGGPRWCKTGDVVSVDDDGCLRIVGRASQDILKVGGYKISAREIEEELARHDDVAEVAVVGIPDAEWGERVCACVVPRAGCAPALADLAASVRLHESKKPRALLVLDALPRNAMGKVTKPALKALAVERATS